MSQNTSATPKKSMRRYRRADASQYLKSVWNIDAAPNTMAKWAVIGGGPPMEYIGRIPTYPEDGLDAWAEARISPRVSNTAERNLQKAA